MLSDVRYAVRSFNRHRTLATVAVFTLALGIGGATAVFSVVDAVILRPLPFDQPDRLVRIWELTPDGNRFSFSEPTYLDLRAQSRTLREVAAYSDLGSRAILADGGDPERIAVVPVSASLGAVLGVQPSIGRMFTPDEDRPGTSVRGVLLSDRLWRRRFDADPQVLGTPIRLDDRPFVITGVMPPRFDFPGGTDAWIALGADPNRDRDDKELAVVGRLAPGATLEQADGELRDFARRISEARPASNAGWSADVVPFHEWIVGPGYRRAVWVLFAAVGLLLLLACANVANLLLAYAASRQVEIRLRAALGAARGRLIRQLLTESALLALLGTAAGVLLALWSLDLVRALGGDRMPRLADIRVDEKVLAFACAAGALSCVLSGLVPALHAARVDLRSSMDEDARITSGGQRLRSSLVVVEVALSLLLLVGAGLLANSFVRLVRVDAGFDASGVLAMKIELPPARYADARVAGFYADLLDRLRAVPGVVAAGATSTNPFRQSGFSNSVTPEERAVDAPASGLVQAGWRSVTPGFFEAMGIPVLGGRTFTAGDRAGADRVVVVTARLARRLWPDTSPIGRRIYWGGTTGRTRTVIGVVGDIRDVALEAEPPPLLFLPHAQVDLPGMTVIVRTTPEARGLEGQLRAAVRESDAGLPAPPVFDVAVSRADVMAGPRFNLSLLSGFAAIALVLAMTGVYGMLSFTVAERRREIAVRLALGADQARIARLLLSNGIRLAALGIAAGTLAGISATRALSALLFGVTPTDPATFAAAALGLLGIAAVTCYLPARRASRLDPAAVLRE